MTAGTARRLLGGDDLATALTVAEHARREDVPLILDVLGLPREGHQPQHLGSLPELADAFGTDLRLGRAPGRPMTVEAAEDVHEHSPACEVWPPHGGTWPVPEQRADPDVVDLRDVASEPVEEPDTAPPIKVEIHKPEPVTSSNDGAPVCELDWSEVTVGPTPRFDPPPVHALATSTAARDQMADARLDDHATDQIEALVARVQKYRPTGPEQPLTLPAAPGRIHCALCRQTVRHDPGQAAAALSEHYTTQHPGGRK